MKLGLNFGFAEITDENRRSFKKRIRVAFPDGWFWLTLEGLASDVKDKDELLIQADNGRRKIHYIANRDGWYGVYCS